MKRRPTIPFFQWRLAVDLERTREIQNQPGMPAYGCTCDFCSRWKQGQARILTAPVLDALHRIGVSPMTPDELYEGRAVYHVVGRILSGPDIEIFHAGLGEHLQHYVEVARSPWVGARVLTADKNHVVSPEIDDLAGGDVIALDFRFAASTAT